MSTCVCDSWGPCLAHDPRYECEDCVVDSACHACGQEVEDIPCEKHADRSLLMAEARQIKEDMEADCE